MPQSYMDNYDKGITCDPDCPAGESLNYSSENCFGLERVLFMHVYSIQGYLASFLRQAYQPSVMRSLPLESDQNARILSFVELTSGV